MNDPDLELDLRGLPCPLPMLTLARRIVEVPPGGTARGVTDNPGAMADLPAWIRATGNALVSSEQDGDQLVFVVRRKG